MIEETDTSIKENTKAKNILTANMQEIWDTVKKKKSKNNRDKRRRRLPIKGLGNIVNKISEKKIS